MRPMTRSDAPWAPGRSRRGTRGGEQRRPRDEGARPPEAEEEEPGEQGQRLPLRRRRREQGGRRQDAAEPTTATARPPKRSTAIPVSGENANIPRMWMLMTNPMTSQPGVPVRHVQRGHHHDAHHDHVAEREGDQPEPGGGDGGDDPQPAASPTRGPGRRRRPSATLRRRASTSGSGRSADEEERDGEQQADQGEDERAGELAAARAHSATGALGPTRLGPSTLPTVVAQTTMLRSRARCAGCARSAAA